MSESDTDRLAALFVESSGNTTLSWLLVLVLCAPLLGGIVLERYEPILFSVVAITLIVLPAITFRDPTVMPPWYFVGLICLPVLWETFAPQPLVTDVVPNLALATLGLLLAVELHRFTSLRLVPWFAVVLTVLFTLAMAGVLSMLRWSADVTFGTTFLLDGRSQDAINAAVMVEFMYATAAGLLAGVIFALYFRSRAGRSDSRMSASIVSRTDEENVEGVVLSDQLGISVRRQTQLVRAMQVVLVSVLLYGVWTLQLPVTTNAALALVITLVPAVLERDYQISIEPGLALWVTAAVFFHALGTAGLYDAIGPYDHLTHTLSATVVAATGYAAIRAVHLHSESVHLPRWALFSFTLVFILAMGVIWEIFEFFVDQGALMLGLEPILAQHGIDDTVVDMLFNTLGAILVATWGTVYLTEVSEGLATQLEERVGARRD
ncbi:hypothetical protein [Natronolimnobius baerhuensis]|uniref:Uncharacterized protein n=1 Tax=Natronolimnobius baerhuensis TaxID=253108 RepID=A0A202E3T1_9EURY|nr:hypothetical protein [Natronolimnobius baerhuensis]OVE82881.1 hypothetical protein B2G88_19000 [Natronolimnobius baerhuensis]